MNFLILFFSRLLFLCQKTLTARGHLLITIHSVSFSLFLSFLFSNFYPKNQALGRRRRWAIRSAARRGAARSARVVGIDFHAPTGHHTQEERRKAEIPIGRACHTCGDFRRSHLSEGLEHGSHAVSTWSSQSFEGKYLRKLFPELRVGFRRQKHLEHNISPTT